MDQASPQIIRLQDYEPFAFAIDNVDLTFELGEDETIVTNIMHITRREKGSSLFLDGQDIELVSINCGAEPLSRHSYHQSEEGLEIEGLGDRFTLRIVTRIQPQANTQLSGLYKSSGNFCTQCEAEGFRRITFYPDRPDVLSKFTTTIIADRALYPVLLSNGNQTIAEGLIDDLHMAVWEDPFPKPAYLFALVAGDLDHIEDHFTTCSGRDVTLRIFTAADDSDKCDHAMDSLKRSMKWDEDTFGLEYDLDIYNIVAVSDFNMGAMENKSLNVFNTSCVLATPETATDANFGAVEGVIAHEYFHNWTGNRVTCRDWFQLSLKEGLTVFRDQQFSADMGSAAVQRIEDVHMLRGRQFPEDAGPQAHPIRPDSYMEINNFYTATIYEKGAEVIRMIHTLLGAGGFRKGMDLYIQRHDGTAATCDDFVAAMADASGVDLVQFKDWYHQAGTPRLTVSGVYDGEAQTYAMTVSQETAATPGQPIKTPLHIPLSMGLLSSNGEDMPLVLEGENEGPTSRVLDVKQASQTFTFTHITEQPTPSLLRGFSAPVVLDAGYSSEDLGFLLSNDSDPFSRWEAGQMLATRIMLDLVADRKAGRELSLDPLFIDAVRRVLEHSDDDKAFAALALSLPGQAYLGQQMAEIDVDGIFAVHQFVRAELGRELQDLLWQIFERNQTAGAYVFNADAVGQRRLANFALALLVHAGVDGALQNCVNQAETANNMTDEFAALSMLSQRTGADSTLALANFYDKWQDNTLVVDKWFAVQATSERADVAERIGELQKHPAFSLQNPNKIRALIGAFSQGNPAHFHAADGSGYKILADAVIALDAMNPQIAARLVGGFNQWRRYDPARQALMNAEVSRILDVEGLSKDVFEIASKTLA
jgi:aminopeptidase N